MVEVNDIHTVTYLNTGNPLQKNLRQQLNVVGVGVIYPLVELAGTCQPYAVCIHSSRFVYA